MSDSAEPSSSPAGFGFIFWVANVIELIERFAYYGVRVILPVFMVEAIELGGPEFDHVQKGTVYAIWALVQSFVPIFTGGFADRYGYKVNIAISTALKIIGYFLMGYCIHLAEMLDGAPLAETRAAGTDSTYFVFFMGAMFLATGTAIFKPGVQGLIANQMPKGKASFGWALFYQCVNIGGFLGPMAAGYLRVLQWEYAFLLCAAAISLNFLALLVFKEPDHHGDDNQEGPFKVLVNAFRGLLEPRLFFFTIAFAGFWLMFYQLFDILPNFIDDWIDSRAVAESVKGLNLSLAMAGIVALLALGRLFIVKADDTQMSKTEMTTYGVLFGIAVLYYVLGATTGVPTNLNVPTINGGNMTQEWMLNANALMISIMAFLIGYITGKVKSLNAIIVGIGISAVAIYALGMSGNGWWTLAAIALFSLGEMTASPTKMRYLAGIAPPGKEGLYMGYVNFTVGIGWSVGSIIAGILYQRGGDKVILAKRYLTDELQVGAAELEALSKNEVMPFFENAVGMDPWQSRELLWDTYSPQSMWLIFTLIGVASMIAIMIYNHVVQRASADPEHRFNSHGHHWVTIALVPIALAFWYGTYHLRVIEGQTWTELLAVIIQAVFFSGLLLLSLTLKASTPASANHED